MKSMTGFGAFRVQNSTMSIEISVRSVNGRFLESRLHIPKEYFVFESEIRKRLSENLARGTVDLFISRKFKKKNSNAQISLNKNLAQKYFKSYVELARDLKLDSQVGLETIARLPDVITIEEDLSVESSEKKLVLNCLDEALSKCVEERMREGKSLQTHMLKLIESLKEEVHKIKMMREEVNLGLLEKLQAKITARFKTVEVDQQRIAQEIVMQIDKSDINEELQRLDEHIKNYLQLAKGRQAEGKKLDFYTQELLREVNTIGSKSQVAFITQSIVEAKTIIERLREQVQNIE
jgi:uncharacterized protein (TIGR00255 family)